MEVLASSELFRRDGDVLGNIIVSIPAGQWWISIISPLLITFLLLKVSGVAMLEKKYKGNPEFEEYRAGPILLFRGFLSLTPPAIK